MKNTPKPLLQKTHANNLKGALRPCVITEIPSRRPTGIVGPVHQKEMKTMSKGMKRTPEQEAKILTELLDQMP